MLVIECREHFDKVVAFAKRQRLLPNLIRTLEYLGGYATGNGTNTRCCIYTDFAPQSFTFMMQRKRADDADYKNWFNGGIIYQGPLDDDAVAVCDGSFPSLTVSLDKRVGIWGVHT